MDWFDLQSNNFGATNLRPLQSNNLGANNLRPLQMIDFFAAERERMPARQPSPDCGGADLEMSAVDSASTSPSAPVISSYGEKEEKGEMASIKAELLRVNADNQRLRAMLMEMHALQQQSRGSSSSDSSTPPLDSLAPLPLLLDHYGRPPNNDVAEPSNATDVRGCGEDDREETSVDDQHHDRRHNKRFKLSPPLPPPPPEKDEEAAAMKKFRVVVLIRNQTNDLDATVKIDGCQWRKYGQKIPKRSPKTPRCYYRCNMGTNCPMRKHLQKCTDDEFVVQVTYQGSHNHGLTPAAVPMARALETVINMVILGMMPYGEALMNTSALAKTLPASVLAPATAIVSTLLPFPSAQLDLSNNPVPARLQGQQQAFLDGSAALGGPYHLIKISAQMLAAASPAFTEATAAGDSDKGGGN